MAKVNTKKVSEALNKAKDVVIDKAKDVQDQIKNIDYTKVLAAAMKVPGVCVDREKYLRKELIKYCDEKTVNNAIEHNPAYAGVSKEIVGKIADSAIKYERRKVTGTSIAISVPSNMNAIVAVPADLAQYYAFLVRVIQKLAYLYGFEDMNLSDENAIDDETMAEVLMFIAVANGVNGAAKCLTQAANMIAKNIASNLAKESLTKGLVYPIFKRFMLVAFGEHVVKQNFADAVANLVPVAGAGLSGLVTYAFFTPCCKRLKTVLSEMNLCDPRFYEEERKNIKN